MGQYGLKERLIWSPMDTDIWAISPASRLNNMPADERCLNIISRTKRNETKFKRAYFMSCLLDKLSAISARQLALINVGSSIEIGWKPLHQVITAEHLFHKSRHISVSWGGEFFFALFPQGSFLIRPSDGATVNVTSHVTSDAGLANVLGGGISRWPMIF